MNPMQSAGGKYSNRVKAASTARSAQDSRALSSLKSSWTAVHPRRMKIVGCARDDAGRPVVLVSPF